MTRKERLEELQEIVRAKHWTCEEAVSRLIEIIKDDLSPEVGPDVLCTSDSGGASWTIPQANAGRTAMLVQLKTRAGEFVCSAAVPPTRFERGFPVPPDAILLRNAIFVHDGAGPGRDREVYLEASVVRLPAFAELS